MIIRLAAAASLSLAALVSVPALAQAGDPYADCAATTDDAARLACFDATYAEQREVIAARAAAEAEAAARAEQREREEFGLNAFQRDDRREEVAESDPVQAEELARIEEEERREEDREVNSAVVEVFQDAARRQVVLLANGQIWRETSNSNMRRDVRPGWEATISRSGLGGFRMTFDGQRGYIGVSRLQ